jgi:hypothetical protein
MRIKIVIAIFLLALGLIQLIDWIIFAIRTENEKLSASEIHAEYVSHFPVWLQAYFENTVISTLACMFLFAIASVLFITERRKLFLVLGIFSFVLAFWQLFSLL